MLSLENFNKSEYLRRIQSDIQKMFQTFEILLVSQKLEPSYINKLFPVERITEFLQLLVRHDDTIPKKDENNKLEIARKMLQISFDYYKERFAGTKYFARKINEISELITDLNQVTTHEIEEDEKIALYKIRRKAKVPPDIRQMGLETDWKARCDICWNWATGKSKIEVMKKVRHHIHCTFNKNDLDNCIRTFSPTK